MNRLIRVFIISLGSFLALLYYQPVMAQCNGGGSYAGSLSMLPFYQTESVNAGERYTFTAYASNTYVFTFCQGGGNNTQDTQLEICNSSGTTVYSYNDDHCGLGSEITWTCTINGTYSVVIYQHYCNETGGSVGTLAYKSVTPPNEQDCLGAIPLCLSTYSTTASYSGTGNYPGEISTSGGCPGNCMLAGELNDVWYTFTVENSGTVSFVIDPVGADDYDWAVYDLTDNECIDISTITNSPDFMVSCNWYDGSYYGVYDTGPTGGSTLDCGDHDDDPFNDELTVTAGETYVVNVSNFSSSQNGYTITFSGSATIVDNTAPYMTELVYDLVCGSNSITIQFSEGIWCTTPQASDFTVTGPQGEYEIDDVWSEICAAGAGSTFTDTFYDDVWTLEMNDYLEHDGNYTVTVNAGGITDICGNANAQSSLTFSIDGITADTAYQHVTCIGDSNGWAEVNSISGGSPPYDVTWTGPGGFSSSSEYISGLEAGSYTVSVTDVIGQCEYVETIIIGEPPAISFNTNVSQPSCGANNGSITVDNINGLFGPYDIGCTGQPTYNDVTSATFNNLGDGSYTITVTDTYGCTATSSVTLASDPPPDASFTYNGNQCFNNQSYNFTHTGSSISGETYLWTFSSGSPSSSTQENPSGVTFSSAGSHAVTLTVTAGACDDTETQTIEVYPLPTPNVTVTDANCGSCDGEAVAQAGYASYNWSGGGSGSSVSGLCAGMYSVTVMSSDGCSAVESFTVNDAGSIPSANVITTDPSCPGYCDGTATVNATGAPSYTYQFSDGDTPNNQSTGGLCAGSYTVTVADATHPSCYTVENFTISDPPGMALTMSSTDANCGLANGSASVSVSGGTSPYSYNWSNGGVTGTINNIPAGFYEVTVTDGSGCTAYGSVSVNDAGIPFSILTSVDQDASCNGVCDGAATVTVTGGTGPFSYQWSSGTNPNDASVTGLCAGTHTVTVSEGACQVNETVTIDEPSEITTTITSTDAHCGLSDGTITVNASGGTVSGDYSYEWNCSPAQFTATASNLSAGNYIVTVKDDNGCEVTAAGSITDVGGVNISMSSSNTQCSGSVDGSATVTVLSGDPDFTYMWNNGTNETTSNSSHTISGIAQGTYTVTVFDTWGCSAMGSVDVVTPNPIVIDIISTTDVSCNGVCDGSATIAVSGGTGSLDITWSGGNNPNATTNTGLCGQNYTVTVTDDNGCTASESVSIDEPNAMSLLLSSTESHCNQADGTASVVVSGGVPPYDYLWSGGTQPTSADNTGLDATGSPYFVTVTDDNGCQEVGSVDITDAAGSTVSISNVQDVTCNGLNDGQATVSIGGTAGPYDIEWSTTPVQNTVTAVNLGPGVYTVSVTDVYGCLYTANATINVPDALTVDVVPAAIDCFGECSGQAMANVTGGTAPYSYLWSDFQTTETAVSLCAGDYEVTVEDMNGCVGIGNVTLDQSPEISLQTSVVHADCGQNSGSIDMTISGGSPGYDIDWSNGAHTEDLVNISAGSYTVTVTDAKGCTATKVVAVNDISGPSASITDVTDVTCSSSCNGTATVSIVGGTGPFGYSWNTVPEQTSPTATNLCAGTYTVDVTDLTTGCIATTNVTIVEPNALDVNATPLNPSCFNSCDGEIQLTPYGGTPPYSFNWTGPGSVPDTEDITGLCAGNYTVVIEDANGCIISRDYLLVEPSFISAPTTSTSAGCNGNCDATATVNPSGGTPPYTVIWSDVNNQTTLTAVSLCQGPYAVTVTDANGCTQVGNVNISEPTAMYFENVAVNSPLCNASANGSAVITPNGGTAPYTYQWSTGSTSGNPTNLPEGDHCVTVHDANGCMIDTCIYIAQPDELIVQFDVADEDCYNACDGSITALPEGGTAPYSYQWSNSSLSQTVNNLCTGDYHITVTDNNDCFVDETVSIGGPNEMAIVVQDTVPPHCGNPDGSITVGVIGGTYPYTYDWSSPGGSTATLSNIPAGNYTVTVTDSHNCSAMHMIDLNDISAPLIDSIQINNVACNGQDNGQAEVFFTSSTPSNTISWSNGDSGALAINLTEGTYTVTVTDDNGCETSETITITEPEPFSVNIANFDNVSCYGGACNGMAVAAPQGGSQPVSYSWSSGQNTDAISNLCPDTYSVTATDVNGCISETSVEIIQPDSITIEGEIMAVSCPGGSDGAISIEVEGGSGAYIYEWFGGSVSGDGPMVNGLPSNNYTVYVHDANDYDCFVSQTFNVPQPPEIMVNFGIVNATCGLDNGAAYISSITGGTPGYTYEWQPGNILYTDSIGDMAPGAYECIVTDASGCTATFPVQISETPPPEIDYYDYEGVTCYDYNDGQADIHVTGGTPPYEYLWSPNVTDSSASDSLPAGIYEVTIVDQDGCEDYVTFPISSPDPVEIITDGDQTICIGQSASVSATATGGTPPYTFHWTDLGTGPVFYVSPEVTTDYMVMAVDSRGCTSDVGVVHIEVNPPLELEVTIPSAICEGEADTLSATASGGDGDYVFNWGYGMVTTNNQIIVGPDTTTTYTVILTDGCGTPPDTSEVTLSIAPQPEIKITKSPYHGCNPLTVNFNNDSPNTGYSYLWNFDDPESGNSNTSVIEQPTHTFEQDGYYDISLVVTTSMGCTDSASTNLKVTASPVADFIAQPWTAGMFSSSIHFNDQSVDATAWEWHFGDGTQSTVQNPDHIYGEAGEIPVTQIVYNSIGCTDTVTKTVEIIEEHRLYLPTAINVRSPGNDEFYPKGVGIDVSSYKMTIYDRWGEPIFTTKDIDEHWLGRSKQNQGDYVPQGVYTWVITLRDKFGKEYTYSGLVTVFK